MAKYVLLGQFLVDQECTSGGKALRGKALRDVSSSWSIFFALDPSRSPSPALISVLTCLALLFCVALAVRPDGLTWTTLQRLRDLFMSFLQSSSTCWAWLLNDDTGVISTLLALATFLSIFFFCYILHRTLAPKQSRKRSACTAEVESLTTSSVKGITPGKKKKKKKNSSKKRLERSELLSTSAERPLSGSTKISSDRDVLKPKDCEQSTQLNAEASSSAFQIPESLSPTKSETRDEILTSLISDSVRTETRLFKTPRPRVESPSTVDTAASSVQDEDSAVGSPSTRNTQHQSRSHKQHRNQNRSKHRGAHGTRNCQDLVVCSRWDALKPDPVPSRPQQERKAYCKNPNSAKNRVNSRATSSRNRRSSVRKQSTLSLTDSQPKHSPPTFSTATGEKRPSSNLEGLDCTSPFDHDCLTSPHIESPTSNLKMASSLSGQTPLFSISNPSPMIRPPPGLSLLMEKEQENNSFYLPSTPSQFYQNPLGLSHVLQPPGLMVPTGAELPSAIDLCGSSDFRQPNKLLVKENPFEEQENEAQIEAELQELGGRMIENILDS